MKSATIKKLMVNLKPEDKPGDKLISDSLERIPLKERGAFFREALLLGALFRKNHPEVLKIASLVASMQSDPTIETVLKTYASMSGGNLDLHSGGNPAAAAEETAQAEPEASKVREKVLSNAKGLL